MLESDRSAHNHRHKLRTTLKEKGGGRSLPLPLGRTEDQDYQLNLAPTRTLRGAWNRFAFR